MISAWEWTPFGVEIGEEKEMKRVIRALLTATVWIAQLIWLGGCAASAKVPEPVLQEQNENEIFKITVIPNQDSFYHCYPYRSMLADGTVLSRFRSPMESRKYRAGPLTPEQQGKIQQILKTMITIPSRDPFGGEEVITLSFLWHGEHYIRSFSRGSCPDALVQLFDITNSVWSDEYFHWEPCQEVEFIESVTSDDTHRLLTSLPDEVVSLHAHRLFQVHWFEQPFSGSYEQLYFVTGEHKFDWLGPFDSCGVYENEPGGRSVNWPATEAERQEVQAILVSLADVDSAERPVGNTLITLGFSWEGDYRILVFGDANCPAGLRRLFEIVDMPFKRDAPNYDLFQNPCAPTPTVTSTLQTP